MTTLPHVLVPTPASDAGASAWARYHWTRARGFDRLVEHLAGTDSRHMATAIGYMALEVSVATLLDALVDAEAEDHDGDLTPFADFTAAELNDTLMAPHCVGPAIWQGLRRHGVDPEQVGRFLTPDEKEPARPEALTLPAPETAP